MKPSAYRLLTDISEALRDSSYEREMMRENYHFNTLARTQAGVKTVTYKHDFAQFSLEWLPKLSNGAKLFVINHIAHNLFKYNLLWHFPPTKKSNEKSIIKELVDNRVLFRTETIGIYLVNPTKMWRGTIFSAVECTRALLREDRPNVSMLRDLKPSDKYTLMTGEDHYNQLAGDGILPNLLD